MSQIYPSRRPHSTTGTPTDATTLLQSLKLTRSELGLFGDTSSDELVVEMLLEAQGLCAEVLGVPIVVPGQVTDRYRAWARRYELSPGWPVPTGTPTVHYHDAGHLLQDFAGAVRWDLTGYRPAVILPGDEDRPELSPLVAAPVEVRWPLALVVGSPVYEAVLATIRMVVGSAFEARGQGEMDMHRGSARSLAVRMLNPHRPELRGQRGAGQ